MKADITPGCSPFLKDQLLGINQLTDSYRHEHREVPRAVGEPILRFKLPVHDVLRLDGFLFPKAIVN